MSDQVQLRIHSPSASPTLIYLPGMHGDWTLVGSFRKALAGRLRFVEMTYPRTLTWSLEDYAQAVETALAEQGITRGWLLGESFGSLVLWTMVGRKRFAVEGVVLAGGFVRHPMRWAARLSARVAGGLPLSLIVWTLFTYAKIRHFRRRHSPEIRQSIQEFIERRTELDRQAAQHRLRLVAMGDPRPVARAVNIPVYALTGLFDPVVPWFWVRRWLRKECPQLRDYQIIRRAEHNILGSAPEAAAELVVKWVKATG